MRDNIIQELTDSRRILLITACSIAGFYFVYLSSVSPVWASLQLIIPLLVIAIILNPRLGYFLALFALPFKDISFVFNVGGLLEYFYFFQIFLFIGAIGWSLKNITESKKKYDGVSITLPIIVFALFCLISLFWDQDYYHAVFEVIRLFFCIFLYYFTLYLVGEKKSLQIIFCIIIISALFVGVGAIVSLEVTSPIKWNYSFDNFYWMEIGFKSSTEVRAGGFASHNQVGFFSNLGIFFTLGALFSSKSYIKRIVLFLIFSTICYGLFLTRSRGAEIALTGGLFVFFILNPSIGDYMKRHFIKISFFVLLFVVVAFVLSQLDRLDLELMRLSSTFETTTKEASFSRRLIIWGEGLNQLVRSYGFGTGIGGFKQYVLPWPHAHSLYFSPLFDLGFIGLLIWIWLILLLLDKLYKGFPLLNKSMYKYYFRGSVAALTALAIHGLVDFEYINENIWFVGGMALAILNLMNREKNYQ
ncbi:MAG: O-antigen ligase family protein [Nitrospirae bacterium]|nr:O-antigen ligase family protein [Nitrospirota bacterium]